MKTPWSTTNVITNFIAITNFIPPGNEPQVQKYWKAKEGNASVELFASLESKLVLKGSLTVVYFPSFDIDH